ncbi:sodium- and chloride-dependent glycine transporter 1 [Patella vulgata]|uniref:sodium- and chloride-dependent glycine transporter 1 n=1 Tax=Patella vulgata TaxID=6465 RepID=UPI00217F2F0E|nr:sodium- and chloride-dependent glycine transporter 1 [Patella vulgata]
MSDSESSRGTWGSQLEFILTSIGCSVGLGNVWRFPYLTYTSGGGAFLVPYFICLLIIGIPLFCLDISFGQFTSLGPVAAAGNISPIFKGVGMCMVTVMGLIMIYYSVVIATCIHYFFASLTDVLPWTDCLNEWNTCNCRQDTNDTDYLRNTYLNCTQIDNTGSAFSPSEEYYTNFVLGVTSGIGEAGGFQWRLVLSNLLTWTIMFFVLIKGVKSIGKVVYVFTILPYVLLTVLLVRGLTLEGYYEGIKYYLDPNLNRIAEPRVWADAAVQIFYSTSTCSGALIAMASFNSFKNNTFRDSFMIPIINALTSFYGGFATFAVLGFMALKKGVLVSEVTKQGPGLAFVVYPEALSKMPAAPFWSVLFFMMMMSLGISSMLTGVETVASAFMDEFPALRKGKNTYICRGIICFCGFLLGLPQVTQGGSYILNLMDTFVGGFPLLFAGLFEIIVLVYIYGFKKFSSDIKMMVGDTQFAKYSYYGFFLWCWTIITPAAIFAVIISKCIDYTPIISEPTYPPWSETLGWFLVMTPIILIPGYALYYLVRYWKTQSFSQMFKPTPQWGPLLPENRTGVYADMGVELNSKENGIENGGGEINPSYVTEKE